MENVAIAEDMDGASDLQNAIRNKPTNEREIKRKGSSSINVFREQTIPKQRNLTERKQTQKSKNREEEEDLGFDERKSKWKWKSHD